MPSSWCLKSQGRHQSISCRPNRWIWYSPALPACPPHIAHLNAAAVAAALPLDFSLSCRCLFDAAAEAALLAAAADSAAFLASSALSLSKTFLLSSAFLAYAGYFD